MRGTIAGPGDTSITISLRLGLILMFNSSSRLSLVAAFSASSRIALALSSRRRRSALWSPLFDGRAVPSSNCGSCHHFHISCPGVATQAPKPICSRQVFCHGFLEGGRMYLRSHIINRDGTVICISLSGLKTEPGDTHSASSR